jgi:hypothetical protein
MFDPTQPNVTAPLKVNFIGEGGMLFHSFILIFFSIPSFLFWGQTQGKTTNPSRYYSIV